jgi:predicted ABC-type ATPase
MRSNAATKIELHFVWIPDVREAVCRVRQRVIAGGHDVPPEDIKRRFGIVELRTFFSFHEEKST